MFRILCRHRDHLERLSEPHHDLVDDGHIVGFALMSVPMMLDYVLGRHNVSDEGLSYGRMLGGRQASDKDWSASRISGYRCSEDYSRKRGARIPRFVVSVKNSND